MNLHFRYSDGLAAAGIAVSNGRGRTRITDQNGNIDNIPKAWEEDGHPLLIHIGRRSCEVRVRLDAKGNPLPIEVPKSRRLTEFVKFAALVVAGLLTFMAHRAYEWLSSH